MLFLPNTILQGALLPHSAILTISSDPATNPITSNHDNLAQVAFWSPNNGETRRSKKGGYDVRSLSRYYPRRAFSLLLQSGCLCTFIHHH